MARANSPRGLRLARKVRDLGAHSPQVLLVLSDNPHSLAILAPPLTGKTNISSHTWALRHVVGPPHHNCLFQALATCIFRILRFYGSSQNPSKRCKSTTQRACGCRVTFEGETIMMMTRGFTTGRSLPRRLLILTFAAACTAGAFTVSCPVFAQTVSTTTAATPTPQLEEVIVTGSRIPVP